MNLWPLAWASLWDLSHLLTFVSKGIPVDIDKGLVQQRKQEAMKVNVSVLTLFAALVAPKAAEADVCLMMYQMAGENTMG